MNFMDFFYRGCIKQLTQIVHRYNRIMFLQRGLLEKQFIGETL